MATSSIFPSSLNALAPKVKHKKSEDLDEKESLLDSTPIRPIQTDFFAPLGGSEERQKRFVVIGDAGTGAKAQTDVAKQMEAHYRKRPFGTVLALGDNVYKHGEPKDFQSKIAEPYRALLEERVKFRPILGNHDVKYGHAEQQLKYWGDVPHYYTFTMGSGSSQTQFWALDTTVLTPGKNGCFKPKKSKDAKKGCSAEELSNAERLALQEIAWLKKSLAESKAPMKVVFGHYPMFSKGPEATNDKGILIDEDRLQGQKELEALLAPLLEEAGVDLYMAGHEHHYEKPTEKRGVRYMVSGAAGGLEKDEEAPRETSDLIRKCHFVSFDSTTDGLRYQAISDKGEVFDEGLIPKKVQARVPAQRRQRINCGDLCGTIAQGTLSCFKGIGSIFAKCCPSFLTRRPQPQKDEAFMV